MVETIHQRSRRRTIAALLLCLAVSLQFAACGVSHIQTLREAEQAFSRAAEMDNRERLDGTAPMAAAGGAVSGYRVAEGMASELIANKSGDLRQDNLLCTAYLIEAMSLWRLGEEDAAVHAAEQGKDCAPAASRDTVPRDRALLHAVPALVRIDQANALALNDTAGDREFDREKTEIVRALAILEEAEAMVPPDHPVQGYLMNSRLAALRVWQVAITRERLVDPRRNQELVACNEQAKRTWISYRYIMKCHLLREGDPSVERWRLLLGLETPRQSVTCDQPPGK
jgi:hypothetical protein